ncbi:MAG TPA: sigma-70 family RNA polymerase sigma factor, partial [Rhizomicrobium sp.]
MNACLVSIAIRQDRAAFAVLFGYFAPRVKAYLLKLGAGPSLAEDLAQEAMIAVWRKAVLFDPTKASASTWIFTIARNLRIDAIRRERRAEYDPRDP